MANNHYETLGVDKNATAEQIKKAYREKCLKFHPDRNEEDTTVEMSKINTAYDCLSDSDKRKNFDENPNGEPSAEEMVAQVLSSTFVRVFNQSSSCQDIILKRMLGELEELLEPVVSEIAHINSKVEQLKKIKERITSKSGNNVIGKIIDRNIQGLVLRMSIPLRKRSVFEKAIEILQDHEGDLEQPVEAKSSTHTTTMNWSTNWGTNWGINWGTRG